MKDSLEFVFKISTIFTSLVIVYFTDLCVSYYPVIRMNKPDDYPELAIFSECIWIPFVSALCLHIFKRGVFVIAKPFWKPFCKDQDDLELLEKRIYKCANNTYKTIFYTFGTIWGYSIMKDSPVYPY